MRRIIIIVSTLLSTVIYSQLDSVDISPLIDNIYRSYGDEIRLDEATFVSYLIFKEKSVLDLGYHHPLGRYFEVIDSIVGPDVFPPLEWYFGDSHTISQEGFTISGGAVWQYEKVNSLPYPLYQRMYDAQALDSIAYFEQFLNMDVRSVCTDQVDVFDGINGTQKGYLVRGDLVEVIAEQGDWAHIKYLKTNKEYWTYQSCLE